MFILDTKFDHVDDDDEISMQIQESYLKIGIISDLEHNILIIMSYFIYYFWISTLLWEVWEYE